KSARQLWPDRNGNFCAMAQLAHALGQVLGQRFFSSEKVRGAGDVDPHRIWRRERNGGAVTERDLCQTAERLFDLYSFYLGDDELRDERRCFGDGLPSAHAEALCLAIDGGQRLGRR